MPKPAREVPGVLHEADGKEGNMIPKQACDETATLPAWVQIYFRYSKSLAYREALELCHGIPSFTTVGEGNEVVHSIALPITEIAPLMRLSELVGGRESYRITINGREAQRQDLVRLGGECYCGRQASEDPEQYCFGDSRLEYNLWGCKRLDMPIEEAGHGWVAYGRMDAEGVWHFDKLRIRQEIERAMPACELCPVFDRSRIFKTLKGLPEAVDPRHNDAWLYRSPTRAQGGGRPGAPVGIAPVATRIGQYVVGDYRPKWDFTRDWRDSKTEVYLGSVELWSHRRATAGDNKTVVIDMEEIIQRRSGRTPLQPRRPSAERKRQTPWPWVVAVALLVLGFWVALG